MHTAGRPELVNKTTFLIDICSLLLNTSYRYPANPPGSSHTLPDFKYFQRQQIRLKVVGSCPANPRGQILTFFGITQLFSSGLKGDLVGFSCVSPVHVAEALSNYHSAHKTTHEHTRWLYERFGKWGYAGQHVWCTPRVLRN